MPQKLSSDLNLYWTRNIPLHVQFTTFIFQTHLNIEWLKCVGIFAYFASPTIFNQSIWPALSTHLEPHDPAGKQFSNL